jgi:hypothetical protein
VGSGTGGAAGTVTTPVSPAWPGAALECPGLLEVESEWPGAAAECPGLVGVLLEWPAAAAECPGLVAVLLEWPGAAAECPGLVDVLAEWPGAVPECPGLLDVLAEWPGAVPECPGLLETEREEPAVGTAGRAGALRPVELDVRLDVRPPAVVGMAARAGADDRIRTGAATLRCRTAGVAGDTAGDGVRR